MLKEHFLWAGHWGDSGIGMCFMRLRVKDSYRDEIMAKLSSNLQRKKENREETGTWVRNFKSWRKSLTEVYSKNGSAARSLHG